MTRRNFQQSDQAKHFRSKLEQVGIRAKVLEKLGNCIYRLEDIDTKTVASYHAKDIW